MWALKRMLLCMVLAFSYRFQAAYYGPVGILCCRDPRGWTAIHHAAYRGHLALLRFLLYASDTDVNCPDSFGCTPLHRSCMGGNKDTTEYLLQKGASHEVRSCCGQTPLHLAAAGGHLGTARTLLQHLASPDMLDSRRWTPLHWAVFGGWGDMAELLLDNGAELEGPSGVGTSPLQLAVMVGNEAAVRLLLLRGADANLRGSAGRTALHLCACSSEKKVISALGFKKINLGPINGQLRQCSSVLLERITILASLSQRKG